MKIAWTFARNDGGRDTGFSDAGVETFKGNIDKYLAREVLQNSLDARHDPNKPVRTVFRLRKLKKSEIPDLDRPLTLNIANRGTGLRKSIDTEGRIWTKPENVEP